MALKQYNPTSAYRRQLVLVDRSELHKGRPEKSLVEGLTKSGGRGAGGRIAVRFRGGGAKRLYRIIDFKRRKFDVVGTVERLEYDPNRTAFIALINYADGEKAYILAPQRLKAGDQIIASEKVDVKPGNAAPLRALPIGTIIHNVELKPLKGGQLARSAWLPMLSWLAVTPVTLRSVWVRVNCAWCWIAAWLPSALCPIRTT